MSEYEKRLDAQIGDTIRKRREALGVTQAQLGAAIGVTFQQVQKYEQGRNRVAASKLILVAEALKCDVGELCGADEEELPGAKRLIRAWSKLRPQQREAVTALVETFRD
ncbi:MAG: helix-turn-helix domain-containing protein [Parvibaculum sp.]